MLHRVLGTCCVLLLSLLMLSLFSTLVAETQRTSRSTDKGSSITADNGDTTLSDNEDSSVAISLKAKSTLDCNQWMKHDTRNILQGIMNRMGNFVVNSCHCVFTSVNINIVNTTCARGEGTNYILIVDANITIPFNQRKNIFLSHLYTWVETIPFFRQYIDNNKEVLITVFKLETLNHLPVACLDDEDCLGSGDEDISGNYTMIDVTDEPIPDSTYDDTTDEDTTYDDTTYDDTTNDDTTEEPKTESGFESGSGLEKVDGENDVVSSSVSITTSITLLLTALVSNFMNYS